MKRIWKDVTTQDTGDGYGVHLDGRPIRTPGKARLLLPTPALADAVAAEWDAQVEKVDPATMPLTRAANSAIDKVRVQRRAVADLLAEYGGTDLLCYRAESPEELCRRQAEAWDRWLDWANAVLGAPLLPVAGVIPQPQPEESLRALRDTVHAQDPFELTGLHDLVTLSGSLILGLAVAQEALAAEDAWELSRVDETWQAELWGTDEDAAALAAAKRGDFLSAANFLSLLRR